MVSARRPKVAMWPSEWEMILEALYTFKEVKQNALKVANECMPKSEGVRQFSPKDFGIEKLELAIKSINAVLDAEGAEG